MQLSPFPKPTVPTKRQWLKNAKTAELLGVDVRTIKRWMTCPATRDALGAIRHGKQWRIPLPDDEGAWEMQIDYRLKAAGITQKPSWQRGLEKHCKKSARYQLESFRLWLAAYLQASVKSEGITQEDITAVLNLWQTACAILGKLPRGAEVDKCKSQFPEQLQARNFSDERIQFIMSYWPEAKYIREVRAVRTLEQLENIRRKADTLQAIKTCKNLGYKPTAGNLRPLLHRDFVAHINDTKDDLPPSTIRAHTPEDLRDAAFADYWRKKNLGQSEINKWFSTAGNPDETTKTFALPSLPMIDTRQPQDGLKLRTFRNRHPLRRDPQKTVIAAVYGQDNIPGADEQPHSGKTPIRDSNFRKNSD